MKLTWLTALVLVVIVLAGCRAFETSADKAAQTVIDHQDQIEAVTEVAQDLVPPPFDWLIGAAGGLLIAAASGWIAYRQGKKQTSPS